jgi:hypothetical protein
MDNRRIEIRLSAGERHIIILDSVQTDSGGPPSLISNGYRGLSMGVKRTGRKADNSLPYVWAILANSTRLHVVVLN